MIHCLEFADIENFLFNTGVHVCREVCTYSARQCLGTLTHAEAGGVQDEKIQHQAGQVGVDPGREVCSVASKAARAKRRTQSMQCHCAGVDVRSMLWSSSDLGGVLLRLHTDHNRLALLRVAFAPSYSRTSVHAAQESVQ